MRLSILFVAFTLKKYNYESVNEWDLIRIRKCFVLNGRIVIIMNLWYNFMR